MKRPQELAYFGGDKVVKKALQPMETITTDEIQAADKVLKTGILSSFLGAPGPGFLGGKEVRQLEEKAATLFGVKHVLSVNSWTSGLIAAIGAIGLEPGDEVITTPWTMCATATAILHWNCIPIFADIDAETFNVSVDSVKRVITKRTKAILAVDIFGRPCDAPGLRKLADSLGLFLITDTAQAPGIKHSADNKTVGTHAHIGGYSLNCHKHIQCGEGGLVVTDSDDLAQRVALIRNHGEAVVSAGTSENIANILGYNFRLGEIEAAIASAQLDKLETRVDDRRRVAKQLYEGLHSLPGLFIEKNITDEPHAFYVFGMQLCLEELDITRNQLATALRSEGVEGVMEGYQNVHLLPMFRRKIAYGSKGFPWNLSDSGREIEYKLGMCPIAEQLHNQTFLGLNICLHQYSTEELDQTVNAFHKVWANISEVRKIDISEKN